MSVEYDTAGPVETGVDVPVGCEEVVQVLSVTLHVSPAMQSPSLEHCCPLCTLPLPHMLILHLSPDTQSPSFALHDPPFAPVALPHLPLLQLRPVLHRLPAVSQGAPAVPGDVVIVSPLANITLLVELAVEELVSGVGMLMLG